MKHLRGAVGLAAFGLVIGVCQGDASLSAPVLKQRMGTILTLGASQSSNWGGYNQGLLEKGNLGFHSISADWTVPSVTPHQAGVPENSSMWIGIGGGCIDAGCTLTDSTLIQAGTEQDVDGSGNAVYSAWWEIIPLPSITATLSVGPGQRVHVEIGELVPEIWTITIQNLSSGQSFSMTVPYPSTYATAEWILETPTVISSDTGVGLASMPDVHGAHFSNATVNGANPGLVSSEAIQLVATTGQVIATPSAPSGGNAFSVCTYSSSC